MLRKTAIAECQECVKIGNFDELEEKTNKIDKERKRTYVRWIFF